MLARITEALGPVIKGVTVIPQKIQDANQAIGRDFQTNAPIPQTNSQKVQELFTSVMDAVAVVQSASGALFVLSTIFYVQSYFSTISSIFSPITTISMLTTGIITYDAHRTYQTMKDLNDWVVRNYPNHNDTFIINDKAYDRWRQFTTELKYNTWLVEPIARTYIDQATQYFAGIKQSFTREQFYRAAKITNDPRANKRVKALQLTVLTAQAFFRLVAPPIKYVAHLWQKMEKAALG